MTIPPSDYLTERKASFRTKHCLPEELVQLARAEKSHDFLVNPAALLCYVYLVDYLKHFSWLSQGNDTPLRILDWGCGKGHITYLLQQAFPAATVTSCDVSGDLAKADSSFGQKTPLVKAFGIQIVPLRHEFQLPFGDDAFDIVVSSGVLEHVPNDQASLHEIHRVLSKGGLFYCTFLPAILSWTQKVAHWMGDGYHDRLYDWEKVSALLEKSGLQLVDGWHRALFPKNPIHYPFFRQFEKMDQWLCENTLLKHLATNLEFIAKKP